MVETKASQLGQRKRNNVASFIEKNSMNMNKERKLGDDSTAETISSSSSSSHADAHKDKRSTTDEKSSFMETNLFLVLLFIRCLSAVYNLIWDCDETYNYWEPLHYLLYGNGFQTWEYSPDFSLRSYLYLFVHALPVWPLVHLNLISKMSAFYLIRFVFAVVTAAIETHLYRSLKSLQQQSINTKRSFNLALYFVLFSITNVGMFQSSTGFLPSTFSMHLVAYAYSSLLRKNYPQAIFSIGLATLMGWPFVGLLGLPIAFDMVLLNGQTMTGFSVKRLFKNAFHFLKYAIFFGVVISASLIAVDSYMFGKLVFAPLNIVKYNVFPSNNQGPELYGKEPFSYYVYNCILNFNFLFPLAVLSPLFLLIDYVINRNQDKKRSAFQMSSLLSILGMYLWMVVFFTRPHKEERFLYPIYSLIILNAVISLNILVSLTNKLLSSSFIRFLSKSMPKILFLVHFTISLMRFLALFNNYGASIEIFKYLNTQEVMFANKKLETKEIINVCVEKEWYRFPSHFFIPETVETMDKYQKWRLRFLESNFKGQLPGYYSESLDLPLGTRYVDKLFNDENKEVRQRYVDLTECDFLIDTNDSNLSVISLASSLTNKLTRWQTLVELPFLNSTLADRLTGKDKLLKSFYVPFVYERKIKRTSFTKFKIMIRDD